MGFFENRPGTEIIGNYLMRSEPGVRNELRENAGYILRKKEMDKIPRVRAVRVLPFARPKGVSRTNEK